MPLFRLGQTEEDVRIEEEKRQAEKLRELEKDINRRNIEQQEKRAKFIKKRKRNRIIVILFTVLSLLSILGIGTYNALNRKAELDNSTLSQIYEFVELNVMKDTPFKDSGVEGYLKATCPKIINNYITFEKEVEYVSIDDGSLYVIKIEKKDQKFADVWFSADVITKYADTKKDDKVVIGETTYQRYNFRLPLYYDYNNTNTYSLAGDLELLSYVPLNENTEIVANTYNSFEGLPIVDEATLESARYFLQESFFKPLYNNKTGINQIFLSNKELRVDGLTFINIESFNLYSGYNGNGSNAECVYILKLPDGTLLKNKTYFTLEQQGTSWVITEMR